MFIGDPGFLSRVLRIADPCSPVFTLSKGGQGYLKEEY
jgi:hypothetical protein